MFRYAILCKLGLIYNNIGQIYFITFFNLSIYYTYNFLLERNLDLRLYI